MEEVKKNKKKNKVASLLLALALILTCGVAGTIAQYQKTLGGNATANVANFKVSASNLNETKDADFDLFGDVKDTKNNSTTTTADYTEGDVANDRIAPGTWGYKDITLKNESEVNVTCDVTANLETNTGKIIDSLDAATVASSIEKYTTYKGKYIPLQYAVKTAASSGALATTVNDSEWSTVDTDNDPFTGLNNKINQAINGTTSTDTPSINMGETKYVRIFWRWAITDTTSETTRNELDTVIGEAMALDQSNQEKVFKNPVLKVEATFTQVD